MAQPQVISSQSPLAAKIWLPRPDWLSAATAIATTPSPNAISTKVPRNSADSSPHTVCRQRPRAPSAPAARADILVTPFRARAPPSALLATVTSWDAWDSRAVPAPAAPSRRGAGDGAARPCRRPLRRRTRRRLPCPFPHHAVGTRISRRISRRNPSPTQPRGWSKPLIRSSPQALVFALSRALVLPLELGAVQLGVEAAAGQQLVVAAALDHAAVVDHQDPVGLADGRQPVGDHQRGAAGQGGLERPLDRDLGLGVQVGGGLVEHDDAGGLEQQPGDRQALLLAAGEAVAAVADDGVEPVGQQRDQS